MEVACESRLLPFLWRRGKWTLCLHKCTFDDHGQRSLGKEESMDKQLIIRMPKEVDHHQVKELSEALDYKIQVQGVRSLIFDFRDTEFMDSSGIGIIIGRSRTMRLYHGEVVAKNMGKRVARIFLAAGLDKVITLEMEEK